TGATLDAAPLADAALAILTLTAPTVDVLEFCRLLRSPFLGGADAEADARAELEYRLRRRGEIRVALADVSTLAAQEDRPWHCPLLARGLTALANLHRQARGRRLPGAWIEVLEQQLAALGWPGERAANHAEQGILTHWYETLASLHQAALLTGEVEYRDVPPLLRTLLRGAGQRSGDG